MPGELPSILVVEDSGDDLLLIQRAFRRAGFSYPIITIGNGDEAIAYLAGAGEYSDRLTYPLPGMMLLGIRLTRKSGVEVLGWLRQQPQLHRMPVVALVHGPGGIETPRAVAAGADACLIKPVRPEDLIGVLRRINLNWSSFSDRSGQRPDTGLGATNGL